MFITIGIVKEFFYVAYITKKDIWCDLSIEQIKISLKVSPNSLVEIYYKEQKIWSEKIEDVSIGFSVESCHTISKIIEEIEKGNNLYKLQFPSPL